MKRYFPYPLHLAYSVLFGLYAILFACLLNVLIVEHNSIIWITLVAALFVASVRMSAIALHSSRQPLHSTT